MVVLPMVTLSIGWDAQDAHPEPGEQGNPEECQRANHQAPGGLKAPQGEQLSRPAIVRVQGCIQRAHEQVQYRPEGVVMLLHRSGRNVRMTCRGR